MSSGQQRTGTLTQWDDAKGYGFITPDGGGARLFVHVQAFARRPHRPYIGERLAFREGVDAQGKRRALDVKALAPRASPAPGPLPDPGRSLLLVPAFAALVLACHVAWGLPPGLWGVYSALSMATFIVYALDKRAARRGDWRVAEATLHLLSLAGGWPGALLAQQTLRHKSAKPSFRRVFWATVALNVVAFALVFTPLWRTLGLPGF